MLTHLAICQFSPYTFCKATYVLCIASTQISENILKINCVVLLIALLPQDRSYCLLFKGYSHIAIYCI